jgi:putative flippase GtrA
MARALPDAYVARVAQSTSKTPLSPGPSATGKRRWECFLQPLRYLAVSGSGTAVNFATFSLLRAFAVPTMACAAMAFAVACRHGFASHQRFTFAVQTAARGRRSLKFLLLSLATLGVNLAVLSALAAAGVSPLFAQVAALAAACPLNFLGSRRWVFAEEPEQVAQAPSLLDDQNPVHPNRAVPGHRAVVDVRGLRQVERQRMGCASECRRGAQDHAAAQRDGEVVHQRRLVREDDRHVARLRAERPLGELQPSRGVGGELEWGISDPGRAGEPARHCSMPWGERRERTLCRSRRSSLHSRRARRARVQVLVSRRVPCNSSAASYITGSVPRASALSLGG